MTRLFQQEIRCPCCGERIKNETEMSHWIRNNPLLDSRDGICVVDQDLWVHLYKIYGNRLFQCLMLVEIKTHGAALTPAQRDTLHVINQQTRNLRGTPTKDLLWQAGRPPLVVRSEMYGGYVQLRAYGMHVLTFSGFGPEDSDVITWDKTVISKDTLTSILRFDLHPDTLKPIDLRNHHRTHATQTLPLPGLELA